MAQARESSTVIDRRSNHVLRHHSHVQFPKYRAASSNQPPDPSLNPDRGILQIFSLNLLR